MPAGSKSSDGEGGGKCTDEGGGGGGTHHSRLRGATARAGADKAREGREGRYEPEFSNVRDNFEGTLDYILVRALPTHKTVRTMRRKTLGESLFFLKIESEMHIYSGEALPTHKILWAMQRKTLGGLPFQKRLVIRY